jgi:hypothetical protein
MIQHRIKHFRFGSPSQTYSPSDCSLVRRCERPLLGGHQRPSKKSPKSDLHLAAVIVGRISSDPILTHRCKPTLSPRLCF